MLLDLKKREVLQKLQADSSKNSIPGCIASMPAFTRLVGCLEIETRALANDFRQRGMALIIGEGSMSESPLYMCPISYYYCSWLLVQRADTAYGAGRSATASAFHKFSAPGAQFIWSSRYIWNGRDFIQKATVRRSS